MIRENYVKIMQSWKCSPNNWWEQYVWRSHITIKLNYWNSLEKCIIFERATSACAPDHGNHAASATVQNSRNPSQLRIVKIHLKYVFFWQAGAGTIGFKSCFKKIHAPEQFTTTKGNLRGHCFLAVGATILEEPCQDWKPQQGWQARLAQQECLWMLINIYICV